MAAEAVDNSIDALMEQASTALVRGSYLLASNMCINALHMARAKNDFGRMARIILPLQEANRYLRQEALDSGPPCIITNQADLGNEVSAGCFLFAPMLVGADARQFRTAANDAGIGVFVLTREPRTAKNKWPIVGVGQCVVRVHIDPPANAVPAPGLLGDAMDGELSASWFAQAAEALGDQAIVDAHAAGDKDDPPAWLVDDFLDRFDACSEHEKFLQAFADACRMAIHEPTPTGIRRRGVIDDPYSF